MNKVKKHVKIKVSLPDVLSKATNEQIANAIPKGAAAYITSGFLDSKPEALKQSISEIAPTEVYDLLTVTQRAHVATKHLEEEDSLESTIAALDEDDLYEAMDDTQIQYVFDKHLGHSELELVSDQLASDLDDIQEAGLAIDRYLSTAGNDVPVAILTHLRTIASYATGRVR